MVRQMREARDEPVGLRGSSRRPAGHDQVHGPVQRLQGMYASVHAAEQDVRDGAGAREAIQGRRADEGEPLRATSVNRQLVARKFDLYLVFL